jgi:ArsR family transcriptional regulator, arsenate/arsenite/antimonite-responsive transcriptional repressor
MDTDPILSFQAPARNGPRVQCGPSPVLELAYAHYRLLQRLRGARGADVPWATELLVADPELARDLESFGAEHGVPSEGPELFVLAGRYGYAFDAGPERFLSDLPALPERYARDGAHEPTEDDEADAAQAEELHRRMTLLHDGAVAARLAALLGRLWSHFESGWRDHGRAVVEAAVAEFEAAFERTGSVLEALPAHHFMRFEHLAQPIVEAAERARVAVVPLWLAAGGGFGFRVDEVHYVGFGLRSQDVFDRTAERVGALARRVKALADPNRLLALTLVSTFARMRPTVGDLAEQVGVSQPTVSGHLRILREAGLVEVEKRGNKSFYRLESAAVHGLLRDLEDALLPPPPGKH